MSAETISQHYNECVAVLDIEHPNQSGLTMRTFEVIASGKKLITTNKKIVEHDFFDPARICVIDRNNPDVPDIFLKESIPVLSEEFIAHYSLRGWILDIMAS
jgi:spore maturation protein CgeB